MTSVQRLDSDGLVDRILSISFIAALGEDEQRRVARQARALAGGATLELRHITAVCIRAPRLSLHRALDRSAAGRVSTRLRGSTAVPSAA